MVIDQGHVVMPCVRRMIENITNTPSLKTVISFFWGLGQLIYIFARDSNPIFKLLLQEVQLTKSILN